MAADLKVIDGGSTASDIGTEKWAQKIKKDVKELSRNLDTGYMALAERLWQIYDTPAYGDSNRGSVFQTFWGYASFHDFVQEELGLHYKKAQRLLNIWKRLAVDLTLPEALRNRIAALGHSKVRELVRVLTNRNAEAWVEKAEKMSYQTLVKAVQKYAEEVAHHQEARAAEEALNGANPTAAASYPFEAGERVERLPYTPDGRVDDDSEGPAWEPEVPDIKNDDLDRMHFAFYKDQADTVRQALKRAAELSNSTVPSNNLSLICLDFLASNDFRKATEEQRLRYLVRFEKLLGFKLIVVDAEANEVVYGINTLEKLATAEEE